MSPPTTPDPQISTLVRVALAERGMSQRRLAEVLSGDPQWAARTADGAREWVGRRMRGETPWGVADVALVARAVGTDPARLLGVHLDDDDPSWRATLDAWLPILRQAATALRAGAGDDDGRVRAVCALEHGTERIQGAP